MASENAHLLDLSINELHEIMLEDPLTLQMEEADYNTNAICHARFDYELLEMEMSLEAELNAVDSFMDFNWIQQAIAFDPGNVNHTEMISSDMNQETAIVLEDNSHLRGILGFEEKSVTDLLLLGAEAVEAGNWALASTVITRLNNVLDQENGEDPFNRLASFFTQGLHYKSINAPDALYEHGPRQKEGMTAFQILQELSPYVKFAHFTANQAILEISQGKDEVHVIDFNIMDGIQWPPLMVDLVLTETSLRITAVIGDPKDASLVEQTGRRLKEFADSSDLPFRFDWLVLEKEEDFAGMEVGHTVIANCMIHQFYMYNRNFSLVKCFLGSVSKLFPKMVVLVEQELFSSSRKFDSMSFVDFFSEAIHHYTAFSASLISSFCDEYGVGGFRPIENEFLGLKILDSVKQFPSKRDKKLWEDRFSPLKGFKAIPMSFSNVSQANYLVSLYSRGYCVQHEKCRLALCWKSMPLTTVSIWIPTSNSR